MWWYSFLDFFFLFFHSLLILFVLVGWVLAPRAHLAVTGLVLLSWFFLGLWYGWGYCPCTDWHWAIKRRLGASGLPASYVKYYLDGITGLRWNATVVDGVVAAVGVGAFFLSLRVNRHRS